MLGQQFGPIPRWGYRHRNPDCDSQLCSTQGNVYLLAGRCVSESALFRRLHRLMREHRLRYIEGHSIRHSISSGMLAFSLFLAISNIVYAEWENRKRVRSERDSRRFGGGG